MVCFLIIIISYKILNTNALIHIEFLKEIKTVFFIFNIPSQVSVTEESEPPAPDIAECKQIRCQFPKWPPERCPARRAYAFEPGRHELQPPEKRFRQEPVR